MGYMHIPNLYKEPTILMFKEAFCQEKIHGSSACIMWRPNNLKKVLFSARSTKHETFIKLFDIETLINKFSEIFPDLMVDINGESYGGKMMGMKKTYGCQLKFIVFDVKVNNLWLDVPNAHDVSNKLGLEFVHYKKVPTTIEALDAERDADSEQAIRNGMGTGHIREGIVIRPPFEVRLNSGARVVAKHKRKEFIETATVRPVSIENLKILTEAREIANEWVTDMRLSHVLSGFPEDITMSSAGEVILAMLEDIGREAEGEVEMSKAARKQIGHNTMMLLKIRLDKKEEKTDV